MKLIADIVEFDIVACLDNLLTLTSIEPNVLGTQKVTFCDLKWMKLYKYVIVDGNFIPIHKYYPGNVVELEVGEIELTGNEVYQVNKPIFFTGTLSNTKWEWNKYILPGDARNKEVNKLPFVWLQSPTLEKFASYENGGSRSVEMTLWLVHWSDWTQFNKVRQEDAIRPLSALAHALVDVMKKQASVFTPDLTYQTLDYPKFGTEDANGVTKAVFDSTLSAIELVVNCTIYNRYCENC